MRVIPILITACVTLIAACSPAGTGGRVITAPDGTQWQQMSVEQLPNLNVPRANHRTIICGDEIVVLGGHTDGFKPIETAEYYSGGTWHTLPMVYPHPNGFAAKLPDGRILMGGGSAEAFGIGRSFGAEIYDPATHTFTSVGIMSVRRTLSSALTMPDGSVLIAGNWQTDDSWETWTPEGGFVKGGPLTPGWSTPYILPAAKDDILVFGRWDSQDQDILGNVTHIGGSTGRVPLLEEWKVSANYFYFPEKLQVADYTYVIPGLNAANEAAIIKVASGEFSLLDLAEPLPGMSPDGNPVEWDHLQVDRPARLIWLQGVDSENGNYCFARIAYDATFDGGKASATYFYAENPGDFPGGAATLLPGGRMVIAGGVAWEKGTLPIKVDYYKTYSSAFIFHTEPEQPSHMRLWGMMTGILVGLGLLLAALLITRRRKARDEDEKAEEEGLSRNLMEQISALIEEKELYRRKNLRITDVASELATNTTYVSVLLNNLSGESFTSLITRCRVEYAKKLLREHPDMLLDDVAEESGFSSRTTFYRSFKALTGMTPQAWKQRKSH